MRVGLIGVGRIGTFHGGVLADHPAVSSLVIASRRPERAAVVAEELGAEAAPSPSDLFEAVDAVVIAAATDVHAELILRAADADLPIFCEKPIALDLESTDRVIDHVRRRGVPLQVGFHRRFEPGYLRARALVADGELGAPYLIRTASHDPEPPPPSFIRASGGIFRDFMIHDIDAMHFVTGQDVEEVYADGSILASDVFEGTGDVDTAVASFRLSEGTLGIASASRHDPRGYDIRMELFGAKDSVVVGWDDRTPLRSLEAGVPEPRGPAYPDFLGRFADAYRRELGVFMEVAAGRAANPCPPEGARAAMAVAVACDLSRAEHRPVAVREVG